MGWQRLGHVYAPRGEQIFLISHASVPFAEPLDGGLLRVWFSPRDAQNRSHVAWLVFDPEHPDRIIEISSMPTLGVGPVGAFDDCGAMMSWLQRDKARQYLYYIGWNTRGTVPFHVSIGLATKVLGEDWQRHDGPILDRGLDDPWFCSNPCVLKSNDGWRMWYLGGLGWEHINGRPSPTYDVRHAVSSDGERWTDRGRTVLALDADEFAIARPSVLRNDDGFLMWFSARTRYRPYRLGAARSQDGLVWQRAPEYALLPPSKEGWDCEMIAYPHVFVHAGRRWMLYCGNGYGRTGFGLAVWD